MNWFVSYTDAKNETVSKMCFTIDQVWEWLADYCGEHGKYPPMLCVYKAECVFDGS